MSTSLLPVTQASKLQDQQLQQRWLIDELWADQAVGIIGGEPKCCKSFLALDIAVAVAAGRPCLRHFPVRNPGRVLLYAAEDAQSIVRSRLEGIAGVAGIDLSELDIQVITVPVLRLDREEDMGRLRRTIEQLRPRLLILDPFVRLHRIDENNSGEVAPILASLREIQRTYGIAIILVHHAKKGGANERAGQALRGSSEFHAWGDSNLYLRRNKQEQLTLTIEQRAGASRTGVGLELQSKGTGLALEIVENQASTQSTEPQSLLLPDRILAVLKNEQAPLSLRRLRDRCHSRASSIAEALDILVDTGQVTRTSSGYTLC